MKNKNLIKIIICSSLILGTHFIITFAGVNGSVGSDTTGINIGMNSSVTPPNGNTGSQVNVTNGDQNSSSNGSNSNTSGNSSNNSQNGSSTGGSNNQNNSNSNNSTAGSPGNPGSNSSSNNNTGGSSSSSSSGKNNGPGTGSGGGTSSSGSNSNNGSSSSAGSGNNGNDGYSGVVSNSGISSGVSTDGNVTPGYNGTETITINDISAWGKIEYVYVDKNAINKYIDSKNGASNIPFYILKTSNTISWYTKKIVYKTVTDSNGKKIKQAVMVTTKNTAIFPTVFASIGNPSVTKDVQQGAYTYMYTTWTSSGPGPVLPKGASQKTNTWKTSQPNNQMATFYNEGSYHISAIDHYQWKLYNLFNYRVSILSENDTVSVKIGQGTYKTYDSFNHITSVFSRNADGDKPPTKSFNMTITPTDLQIPIVVHDMNTNVNYDADPYLVG